MDEKDNWFSELRFPNGRVVLGWKADAIIIGAMLFLFGAGVFVGATLL